MGRSYGPGPPRSGSRSLVMNVGKNVQNVQLAHLVCGKVKKERERGRRPLQGCQMAKFDPFLSLDCAMMEGVGAQSKERKGSNFVRSVA